MADENGGLLSPPPLSTPMFDAAPDEHGVPFEQRIANQPEGVPARFDGFPLTPPWALFFLNLFRGLLEVINNGGDGGGSGAGGAGNLVMEVPIGAIDGANRDFYLTYNPLPESLPWLYLNEGKQLPPRDTFGGTVEGHQYEITANHITMNVAPQVGDTLFAEYFKTPGATPTPLPQVLQATAALWSARLASDRSPYADARYFAPGSSTGSLLFRDGTVFPLRLDTLVVSTTTVDLSAFDGALIVLYLDDTTSGALSATDWQIYDAYLTLQMSDGTTILRRPKRYVFFDGSDHGATTWQANHTYLTGNRVLDFAGYYYQAAIGGLSGGSEPAWDRTTGHSTVDGGVTWICQGLNDSLTGQLVGDPKAAFDADTVPPASYVAFRRTKFSPLSDSGVLVLVF